MTKISFDYLNWQNTKKSDFLVHFKMNFLTIMNCFQEQETGSPPPFEEPVTSDMVLQYIKDITSCFLPTSSFHYLKFAQQDKYFDIVQYWIIYFFSIFEVFHTNFDFFTKILILLLIGNPKVVQHFNNEIFAAHTISQNSIFPIPNSASGNLTPPLQFLSVLIQHFVDKCTYWSRDILQ